MPASSNYDLASVWDMTDMRPWEGRPDAVIVFVEARISDDPGNDMSGVMRQVHGRLDWLAQADGFRLAGFPGSPVDAGPRRRRKRDPATHQLINFPPRGGEHWPPGCLVDNDKSAAVRTDGTVAERPEHDKGADMLRSHEVRGVTAAAPDRIWRSQAEYDAFRQTVKNFPKDIGVRVLAHGDFNLSRANDHMVLSYLTIAAGAEVERTQEREKDALDSLARSGAKHGIAPFGYKAVHLEPGDDPLGVRKMHEPFAGSESGACPGCQGRKPARWRSMVLEPREAAALHDAGMRVLAGESIRSILAVLDDEWKTLTKKGLPWRLSGSATLNQVLRNPVYLGMRVHVPDTPCGAARRAAWEDPDSWHEAGWPAVFTAAEHGGLVRQLTRKAKGRGNWNTRASHMLTGLTWCQCGEKAFAASGVYRCFGHGKGHATRTVRDVEAEAESRILLWMADDGLYGKAQAAADSDDMRKLRDERDEKEKERDRMFRNAAAFDYTDEQVREQAAPVVARIAELTRLLQAAQNLDEMADVTERGEAFSDRWEGWDTARRREIATRLIDKIVIHAMPLGLRRPDIARRFLQVFPAVWAKGLTDPSEAAPPPALDAEAMRPRPRILAWLAEHGTLASPVEIAAGTDSGPGNVRKGLAILLAEGKVERERYPRATRGAHMGRPPYWGYRLPA